MYTGPQFASPRFRSRVPPLPQLSHSSRPRHRSRFIKRSCGCRVSRQTRVPALNNFLGHVDRCLVNFWQQLRVDFKDAVRTDERRSRSGRRATTAPCRSRGISSTPRTDDDADDNDDDDDHDEESHSPSMRSVLHRQSPLLGRSAPLREVFAQERRVLLRPGRQFEKRSATAAAGTGTAV